ncbi:MAG: FeoA family protein [Bacteroidetes bacterium]|nr:FeoA family protein [Bacteroidota bacterium]
MPPAPLTTFCDGCPLMICSVHGCAEERLRDMGLREGARVEVVQNSDKLIVRLAGCRIGLRRDMAADILATPVEL